MWIKIGYGDVWPRVQHWTDLRLCWNCITWVGTHTRSGPRYSQLNCCLIIHNSISISTIFSLRVCFNSRAKPCRSRLICYNQFWKCGRRLWEAIRKNANWSARSKTGKIWLFVNNALWPIRIFNLNFYKVRYLLIRYWNQSIKPLQ